MDKQTLKKIKQQLEERKNKIEQKLGSIATKDGKIKGDYDTVFPDFGASQSPDESALEVTAYENTLPIEYALELKLADVTKALDKIEKGTYGICEKCGESIDPKRLEIMPEAKFCLKCQKK